MVSDYKKTLTFGYTRKAVFVRTCTKPMQTEGSPNPSTDRGSRDEALPPAEGILEIDCFRESVN